MSRPAWSLRIICTSDRAFLVLVVSVAMLISIVPCLAMVVAENMVGGSHVVWVLARCVVAGIIGGSVSLFMQRHRVKPTAAESELDREETWS